MSDYVIEMLNITKEFPGIIANDDITLKVRKGEIHALLGENGAGKSTLMSVLFGMYKPDKGSIRIMGKEVNIQSPNDANRYGIGMVHQHFKLVGNFTVLENIVLGVESVRYGFLRFNEARRKVTELSEKYGLQVDLDRLVDDIAVGMQQRVEILKMLYRDNDILIFDEPTAVLTPQEIEELMKIMKGFAAEGKSILFITHKLDEIKAVADRCTVLRKGKCVGCIDVATTTKEEMSEMMVGRKVDLVVQKKPANVGKPVLEVKNLYVKDSISGQDKVKDVSFTVNEGEIVCIAGVDGNGQAETIEAITGLMRAQSGSVFLDGEDITNRNIQYRNTRGISFIPEDRHKFGLVLDYNIAENMILKEYNTEQFQKKKFMLFNHIYKYADDLIEKYDIRSGQGSHTITRSMSGGNQQKVILAREIERDHKLLIAVQPVRGLDIGAIAGISIALLALSNPLGIIFVAIFIAYITVGGFQLQMFNYPTQVVDMIISAIIYFSAFAMAIRILVSYIKKRRDMAKMEEGAKSK